PLPGARGGARQGQDDRELMGARPPAAEIVRRAIAQSYARLDANELGVFDGRDPEAIHQARVATRRLRSDLRTFEPLMDRDWTTRLRADLQWLGADLGDVRDLEVLRARLADHAGRL